MSARLRVCALYPELMNIYADRGNITVLRARCEWRGIGFELASASLRDPLDPDAHDLLYLGGGQDRDQIAVAEDMADTKRSALHAAADRGAVVLAVCGGYQLLGHSYQLGEQSLPGVGLVDLHTVREQGPRLIGNCAIEADLGQGPRVIAGFENHGGRTYLGRREPARAGALRPRQQRPGRSGGGQARERDRYLPARTAAAEERLARGPPDRACAGHRARAPAGRWPGGLLRPRPARAPLRGV